MLVIDRLGFHEATSTAEYMAEQGCQVEVVTQTLYVGQDLGVTLDLENWYRQARRLGIKCTPNYSVLASRTGGDGTAQLQRPDPQFPPSRHHRAGHPSRPNAAFMLSLKGRVPDLHRIGDCVAPRRAHAAIIEGEKAGRAV